MKRQNIKLQILVQRFHWKFSIVYRNSVLKSNSAQESAEIVLKSAKSA